MNSYKYPSEKAHGRCVLDCYGKEGAESESDWTLPSGHDLCFVIARVRLWGKLGQE